jgi:hypothetical protein
MFKFSATLNLMLPILQGLIDRRGLLNSRAGSSPVQKLLLQPLVVDRYCGHAMVGVGLIDCRAAARPEEGPAKAFPERAVWIAADLYYLTAC